MLYIYSYANIYYVLDKGWTYDKGFPSTEVAEMNLFFHH